jgi:hypothetical protein
MGIRGCGEQERRTMRLGSCVARAAIAIGLVVRCELTRAQSVAAIDQSPAPSVCNEPLQPQSEWTAGGFLDAGYLKSFNSPANHLFRSRGTTPRVDELNVNMGGIYARKHSWDCSPWGLELTIHGGEDAKIFGFSATAPNMPGANWLRHLGPTNFSYRAPIGSGVTLQGGIFSSFVGYDSLYAKDNYTYTRPWTADFTPYLMLGVNAGYAVNERLTATALIVNGYWHLAHANDIPSAGGQLAYQPSDRVTVKETVLYGPHQSNTSLRYWRLLSDSIVERKFDRAIWAFEFQLSTEVVDAAGHPRLGGWPHKHQCDGVSSRRGALPFVRNSPGIATVDGPRSNSSWRR